MNVDAPQAVAITRSVERQHRREHAVGGYVWACTLPEFPVGSYSRIEFDPLCRPCLTAMVAAAVNRPRERVVRRQDVGASRVVSAASSALTTVRDLLDEVDPLRVRAEQELVPLVAPS